MALLVDSLYQRYFVLNEFVDNADRDEIHILSMRTNFGRLLDEINRTHKQQKTEHNIGCHELYSMRRVCTLLYTASHTINNLFRWTLPLCIFSDFIHFLFDVFHVLDVLMANQSNWVTLITPIIRILMVGFHIIFFLSDCNDCEEEATKCAAKVHQLGFHTTEPRFRQAVGIYICRLG